jgi:hypothetical protein
MRECEECEVDDKRPDCLEVVRTDGGRKRRSV